MKRSNMNRGSLSASTLLLVIGGLAAGLAQADPRWWWDDVPVTAASSMESVDICVAKDLPPDGGRPHPVFIAWSQPPGMIGSLYLTASFDGGCSFCAPVRIAGVEWNTHPTVAVALLPSGTYSIAVAYQVFGNLVVLTDSVSMPRDGTPQEQCAAFQGVATGFVRHDVSTGNSAEAPEIVGASLDTGSGTLTHFHLVWVEENGLGERDVLYARDLTGDGSGWTVVGSLTTGTPPSQTVAHAKVSMDFMVGETPPAHSAVNVAYVDTTGGQVYYERSTDSGGTFSATGVPPATPPLNVRDNDPAVPEALAFDSGLYTLAGKAPAWHGAVWVDPRAGAAGLYMDARRNTATGISPPFAAPDVYLEPVGPGLNAAPALSVSSHEETGTADAFVVWSAAGGGFTDLYYRGGTLLNAIDMGTFPFPAARANDPSISAALLLTACGFDAATGGCVSNRAAGSAVAAAMDEHGRDVYVAWLDDRSSRQQVWFKRTDRSVVMAAPGLATDCVSAAEARITTTISPLPTCASAAPAAEKMLRYYVYYGVTAGGPYENTDLDGTNPGVPDTIVIDDNGSLPDPLVVQIPGLSPSTRYYVIVVPEDQARNLYPATLDPEGHQTLPPPNEASVTTPGCGGPCNALVFPGQTVAQPAGECRISVTWDTARGEGAVTYTLTRMPSFATPPPALGGASYTDTDVVLGTLYVYQVTATDSCPPPSGPQTASNNPSAQTFAQDAVGPRIVNESLRVQAPCTVSIDASVTADCSPVATLDIVRELAGSPPDIVTFPAVTLPWQDTVSANGQYTYRVRAEDGAGNESLSVDLPFQATQCEVVEVCLHRARMQSLVPLQPGKSDVFTAPDPRGVSLDPAHPNVQARYVCPFATGDSDPEAVLDGTDPLIYYQVDDAAAVKAEKDAANRSVKFTFP